jgi:hypothetical protein
MMPEGSMMVPEPVQADDMPPKKPCLNATTWTTARITLPMPLTSVGAGIGLGPGALLGAGARSSCVTPTPPRTSRKKSSNPIVQSSLNMTRVTSGDEPASRFALRQHVEFQRKDVMPKTENVMARPQTHPTVKRLAMSR